MDYPIHTFFFSQKRRRFLLYSWWIFQLHPWKSTAGSPKNHLKLKRNKIFWPKPFWLWVPNVNCPGCKQSNDDPNANPPPSGNEAYFIRIIENPPVFWCFFRGGGTWTYSKIQSRSTRTKLTHSAPLTCYRLASSDFFRHGGGKEETNRELFLRVWTSQWLHSLKLTVCPSKKLVLWKILSFWEDLFW